jgi:hypothetical protein
LKNLFFIILLFWILLIENGTNWLGVIFDFNNGFEIRFSLLLKILFLVFNFFTLFIRQKIREIKYLFRFMIFLLCSTIYVGIIHPEYFLYALSVNLHIQLVLSLIIYIYWSKINLLEIKRFYQWLRFFGLFNALLVIISYTSPSLIANFEVGNSISGMTRAFGIMGDEVSIFLTFFIYDSLIFNKKIHSIIYTIALFCTGSIGSFFTFLVLIFSYLFRSRKKLKKLNINFLFFTIFLSCGALFFSSISSDLTVIKRIKENFYDTENESAGLRILSLSTAFEMVSERPIFGTGFGSYDLNVYKKYDYLENQYKESLKIIGSSYNPYVQMICEAGFVGLFFLLYFLKSSLKVAKPNDRNLGFIFFFKTTTHDWLLIIFFTYLSANWLLPSSFIFLLISTVIGINLRLTNLEYETAV